MFFLTFAARLAGRLLLSRLGGLQLQFRMGTSIIRRMPSRHVTFRSRAGAGWPTAH